MIILMVDYEVLKTPVVVAINAMDMEIAFSW